MRRFHLRETRLTLKIWEIFCVSIVLENISRDFYFLNEKRLSLRHTKHRLDQYTNKRGIYYFIAGILKLVFHIRVHKNLQRFLFKFIKKAPSLCDQKINFQNIPLFKPFNTLSNPMQTNQIFSSAHSQSLKLRDDVEKCLITLR